MPDLDINGLPLASAVNAGDFFVKWDSTQVSGQRTQKLTAAQFRDYVVQIIPYGPAGPPGPTGAQGPQGAPGKDGSGAGTVTSVALSLPSDFGLSGSPITSSGTFAVTRNAQAANVVMAGPASGANAGPTYRALVAADIPALPYTTTSQAAAAAPVQSVAGRTGNVTLAVTDVSGAAKSGANTDITSLSSPALGAATATTQTAGTANTTVATTGFVATAVGGSSGGSGFPSTFSTKPANYTVVTADKNTLFSLTGSFTLTLPSAASFGAGNGIYLSKTDGSGAWTLTPASGTVDGRPSISVYQERFSLVSDGTNWQSVNRPKGWINIGTTTVSSAVASVLFTLGFADSELRDMQIDYEGVTLSISEYLILLVQKSGSLQSTNYSYSALYNNASTSSAVAGAGNGNFSLTQIQSAAAQGGIINIYAFANAAFQRLSATSYITLPSMATTEGNQTTAAVITGASISPRNGNLTAGTFNQKGFRP